MKRYIFHFIYFCFAWLAFTSCEQEEMNPNAGSGTLTLQLNIGNMLSRSAGDETLNENLISTLDIFLYPNNAAETDGASKYITVSPNQDNSYTVDTKLTEDEIKKLFGANATSGTCKVYVIANRPNGVDLPATTSISALKQLAVTAAFIDNTDNGSAVQKTARSIPGRQANFVMDSDATNDNDGYDVVTLATDETNKKSLSGTVPLYRSAAKIGLFVNVEDEITDANGVIWTSNPNEMKMKMTFHNGVKDGYIGNDRYTYTVDYRTDDNNTDYNLFSIEDQRFLDATASITTNGTTTNYYTSPAPYYSYPWNWNSLTSNDDTPYITLIIPWKRKVANQYLPCKYQIPVNALATNKIPTNSLQRNTYYQMLLNVGILGAFDETGTVELTPSYMVVNWGSEEINTTLKENVYLVVQEHDVTINNKNEYSVEFASSHDIEVQILSITQPNYSQEIAGTSVFCDYNEGEGESTIEDGTNGVVIIDDEEQENLSVSLYRDCSVSVNENTIKLEHIVVNRGEETIAKEYDIAPYTITVYVKMVYGTDSNGNDLFYDDIITFTQFPSMYAEAKLNDRNDSNHGNVYVYNQNEYDDPQWSTVRGAAHGGTSSNHNPNMYVIHVSALSLNDPYVISDPRDTGTAIKGNTSGWDINNDDDLGEKLTNYYQARTDDASLIAPIFRMASSHGKCGSSISYNDAKRRCAAYQEDGLPAGRWRMPTTAELQYIAKLSSDGKIPHLYSNNGYYWTATGKCQYFTNGTVNPSTSTSGDAFVRCVYDEWYWGDDQITPKTQFTWGDE